MAKKLPKETQDDCVEWRGAMYANGYGKHTAYRKNTRAHRHVYRECFGDFDRQLVIHHTCENKKCVNPEHLQLMTRADHNALHNAQITHCPQGHEYTKTNTYVRKSGCRVCRQCRTEKQKEAYHAKAAA